jgi:hypothetical protein
VIPAAVTSRPRVVCPERGNGMVRLTAWVRGGSGGTSWTSRRNSGPELAPAPSTDGGNANGSEEALGPARPGPRGVMLVPRKRVAIPPVPWGMSRVRSRTSSTTRRTSRRAVMVSLDPSRPSADRPVTCIETALTVVARTSLTVPSPAGPGNRSRCWSGSPNPQLSTALTGSEAS